MTIADIFLFEIWPRIILYAITISFSIGIAYPLVKAFPKSKSLDNKTRWLIIIGVATIIFVALGFHKLSPQ